MYEDFPVDTEIFSNNFPTENCKHSFPLKEIHWIEWMISKILYRWINARLWYLDLISPRRKTTIGIMEGEVMENLVGFPAVM